MGGAQIELDGATYSIGTLSAMHQFHVARRIAPVQMALGISFSELAKAVSPTTAEAGGDSVSEEQFASAMKPVFDIVAKMPDEEVNYVIRHCLAVVRRKDGERWAQVQNGEQLMYQDIKMPTMMRLVMEVIKANMGDFFGPLLGALPSGQGS